MPNISKNTEETTPKIVITSKNGQNSSKESRVVDGQKAVTSLGQLSPITQSEVEIGKISSSAISTLSKLVAGDITSYITITEGRVNLTFSFPKSDFSEMSLAVLKELDKTVSGRNESNDHDQNKTQKSILSSDLDSPGEDEIVTPGKQLDRPFLDDIVQRSDVNNSEEILSSYMKEKYSPNPVGKKRNSKECPEDFSANSERHLIRSNGYSGSNDRNKEKEKFDLETEKILGSSTQDSLKDKDSRNVSMNTETCRICPQEGALEDNFKDTQNSEPGDRNFQVLKDSVQKPSKDRKSLSIQEDTTRSLSTAFNCSTVEDTSTNTIEINKENQNDLADASKNHKDMNSGVKSHSEIAIRDQQDNSKEIEENLDTYHTKENSLNNKNMKTDVWPEILPFSKIEIIPVKEIEYLISVDAVIKYYQLQLSDKCIVVKAISKNLKDISIEIAEYRESSSLNNVNSEDPVNKLKDSEVSNQPLLKECQTKIPEVQGTSEPPNKDLSVLPEIKITEVHDEQGDSRVISSSYSASGIEKDVDKHNEIFSEHAITRRNKSQKVFSATGSKVYSELKEMNSNSLDSTQEIASEDENASCEKNEINLQETGKCSGLSSHLKQDVNAKESAQDIYDIPEDKVVNNNAKEAVDGDQNESLEGDLSNFLETSSESFSVLSPHAASAYNISNNMQEYNNEISSKRLSSISQEMEIETTSQPSTGIPVYNISRTTVNDKISDGSPSIDTSANEILNITNTEEDATLKVVKQEGPSLQEEVEDKEGFVTEEKVKGATLTSSEKDYEEETAVLKSNDGEEEPVTPEKNNEKRDVATPEKDDEERDVATPEKDDEEGDVATPEKNDEEGDIATPAKDDGYEDAETPANDYEDEDVATPEKEGDEEEPATPANDYEEEDAATPEEDDEEEPATPEKNGDDKGLSTPEKSDDKDSATPEKGDDKEPATPEKDGGDKYTATPEKGDDKYTATPEKGDDEEGPATPKKGDDEKDTATPENGDDVEGSATPEKNDDQEPATPEKVNEKGHESPKVYEEENPTSPEKVDEKGPTSLKVYEKENPVGSQKIDEKEGPASPEKVDGKSPMSPEKVYEEEGSTSPAKKEGSKSPEKADEESAASAKTVDEEEPFSPEKVDEDGHSSAEKMYEILDSASPEYEAGIHEDFKNQSSAEVCDEETSTNSPSATTNDTGDESSSITSTVEEVEVWDSMLSDSAESVSYQEIDKTSKQRMSSEARSKVSTTSKTSKGLKVPGSKQKESVSLVADEIGQASKSHHSSKETKGRSKSSAKSKRTEKNTKASVDEVDLAPTRARYQNRPSTLITVPEHSTVTRYGKNATRQSARVENVSPAKRVLRSKSLDPSPTKTPSESSTRDRKGISKSTSIENEAVARIKRAETPSEKDLKPNIRASPRKKNATADGSSISRGVSETPKHAKSSNDGVSEVQSSRLRSASNASSVTTKRLRRGAKE